MKNKIPFYPKDYMNDTAVRSVSLSARGLWIDMLCLMHESARRGYLQHDNGNPIDAEQLFRIVGCSNDEGFRLLKELEDCAAFVRTKQGIIYSRRMIEGGYGEDKSHAE
jgi:hypothetical protein